MSSQDPATIVTCCQGHQDPHFHLGKMMHRTLPRRVWHQTPTSSRQGPMTSTHVATGWKLLSHSFSHPMAFQHVCFQARGPPKVKQLPVSPLLLSSPPPHPPEPEFSDAKSKPSWKTEKASQPGPSQPACLYICQSSANFPSNNLLPLLLFLQPWSWVYCITDRHYLLGQRLWRNKKGPWGVSQFLTNTILQTPDELVFFSTASTPLKGDPIVNSTLTLVGASVDARGDGVRPTRLPPTSDTIPK